jgi:hypothetical protein
VICWEVRQKAAVSRLSVLHKWRKSSKHSTAKQLLTI